MVLRVVGGGAILELVEPVVTRRCDALAANLTERFEFVKLVAR